MKRTILIADDEKNIRNGLSLALEDEGYNVLTAADGQEAWALLTREDVDLLITDLRMPKVSGTELLKKGVGCLSHYAGCYTHGTRDHRSRCRCDEKRCGGLSHQTAEP